MIFHSGHIRKEPSVIGDIKRHSRATPELVSVPMQNIIEHDTHILSTKQRSISVTGWNQKGFIL